MCRYTIGQKIELWRIEGGKHPRRVLARRVVTIKDFAGEDNHKDLLSLKATDCRGREYVKTRPVWTGLGLLEILSGWSRIKGSHEQWVEAVVATTHAFHSSHPVHYWDGHGHEVKPSGRIEHCRKHHIWTHRSWRCPESGHAVAHSHFRCYSEPH